MHCLLPLFSFLQRLKNFFQENSKVLDGNTVNLMYPVFIHMYVELINNGHKTPGMYKGQNYFNIALVLQDE